MTDGMLARGLIDASVALLSEPLEKLREQSSQGRPLGRATLDHVGLSALKLALATNDSKWAALAIEIHIAAKRPLCDAAIDRLVSLTRLTPGVDWDLVKSYQAAIRAGRDDLDIAEQALCDRILCLGDG